MSDRLIVIIGPTASGKSAAALALAQRIDGEIICADSRTVYRGMDIGTAKPTLSDQARVRHHLIDIVEPGQAFSVADFRNMALAAIDDIVERGKTPILVGGTGLYVDSVIFGFTFGAPANLELRERLAAMSVDELQTEILERNLPIPRNENNPRHLMRVIETGGYQPTRQPLRPHTLVLGIRVPREVLVRRIQARVESMVNAGFVDEVQKLYQHYDHRIEALRAPGYRAFYEYINGRIGLDEAKALFVKNDSALAKRQLTWFRRNDSIQWVDDPLDVVAIATTFLNKIP